MMNKPAASSRKESISHWRDLIALAQTVPAPLAYVSPVVDVICDAIEDGYDIHVLLHDWDPNQKDAVGVLVQWRLEQRYPITAPRPMM
jgi:hypothetical protein